MSYFDTISEVIDTNGDVESIEVSIVVKNVTGTVNITDIVAIIHDNIISVTSPVFLLSLALIFFGWLYASGLPPFHTIKSGIYSKAEPHGAALLQSFTVISMISIVLVMFRI